MHTLSMSLSRFLSVCVFAILFNLVTNKYKIVQHFAFELVSLSYKLCLVLLRKVYTACTVSILLIYFYFFYANKFS